MIEQVQVNNINYEIKYDPEKYSREAMIKHIEISHQAKEMYAATYETGAYHFKRLS